MHDQLYPQQPFFDDVLGFALGAPKHHHCELRRPRRTTSRGFRFVQ